MCSPGGGGNTGRPILRCLAPVGAAIAKWLPPHPVNATVAIGGSLGEWGCLFPSPRKGCWTSLRLYQLFHWCRLEGHRFDMCSLTWKIASGSGGHPQSHPTLPPPRSVSPSSQPSHVPKLLSIFAVVRLTTCKFHIRFTGPGAGRHWQ